MTGIYDVDSAIRAYREDTNGHFFDADTMRFFGCRVSEVTILKNEAGEVTRVLFIMRQLRNGFASDEKIYRLALYTPGSSHRCECCGQRDQRGDIDYLEDGEGNMDYETLRAARKAVLAYYGPRATVTL